MKGSKITKYRNEINRISMRGWTADEMNFFFAIITRMRDENLSVVTMDKKEIMSLASFENEHFKGFEKTLNGIALKIINLVCCNRFEKGSEVSFSYLPLFTLFRADFNYDTKDVSLKVKVNKEFQYILNHWNEGNWTKFMLDEFTEIKSIYSKTLFRLLKQYRTVGEITFNIEEFRMLMDIPDSYKNSHINEKIITRGVKDLEPYFNNLKCKIVKANTRGNPVTGYKFTWTPEKTEEYVEGKYNQVDAEDYVESKKPNSKQNKKSTNGKKRKKLKNERNYTPEERRKMINKKLKISRE